LLRDDAFRPKKCWVDLLVLHAALP
jgi:hypothetical protein